MKELKAMSDRRTHTKTPSEGPSLAPGEKLTKPMATYTHSRRAGALVFIAGQGCRDPETDSYPGLQRSGNGALTGYDIKAQTRGVLANVERALRSEGLDRRALIDVQVFLCDMADFAAMNEVWNEFFRDVPPPTRTTVAVKALPGFNYIEMKAIALASDRDAAQEL